MTASPSLDQYKHIIPRWEVLFALKNPWSDVTALKPSWTKDKRGPPPPNAAESTLKTAADFQEIVEARLKAAEKRKAADARKRELAAEAEENEAPDAGPSAAPKEKKGKKTTKRAKKAEIVSPPAASREDEDAD